MTLRKFACQLVSSAVVRHRCWTAPGTRLAVVLGLALATTACSGAPEWANPTSWWGSSARDRAAADSTATADTTAVPGADKPYPRLSETPARPAPLTTAEERREVSQGLVADRANASYSSQQLQASGTAAPEPQVDTSQGATAAPSAPPAKSLGQAAEPVQTAQAVETRADRAGTATMGSQNQDERPMSVPSIVQRHGTWPRPAPSSIEEVSRGRLGQPVQSQRPAAPAETVAGPAPTIATAPVEPPREAREPSVATERATVVAETRPVQPAQSDLQPPVPPAPPPIDQALIRSLPIGDDQAALVESFAARLAEQKAATPPISGGTVFAAPKAAPISRWEATVPSIVRDSYNQALQESAPAPVMPMSPSSYAGPATPPRYDVAMTGQDGRAKGMAQNGSRNGHDGSIGAAQMNGAGHNGAMGQTLAALNNQPVVASNGSLAGITSLSDIEPAAGGPLLVHFGHGSSRLSGRAQQELDAIADAVKSRGLAVRVVGHASQRTGDMPYSKHKATNQRMSLARANMVARELRRNGVPKELIVVEARGDDEPIYYEFMPEGEAQNRRVEIFLQ